MVLKEELKGQQKHQKDGCGEVLLKVETVQVQQAAINIRKCQGNLVSGCWDNLF